MSGRRSRFCGSRVLANLARLGVAVLLAGRAAAAESEGEAPGVNPRDNISKTELILKYDDLDLADHVSSFTFKYDQAFGSSLGANIEVPVVSFRGFGMDELGLGDVQLRMRYSFPAAAATVVTGVELVLPTASDETLGRGKYQLNPTVGVVTQLTQTSFLFVGYKHLWSIGGDDDRPRVNESQPRVIVGHTSPQAWWLLGDVKYTRSWTGAEAEQLDVEVEYGWMVGRSTGVWARVGTSFLDSDREVGVLVGVRFIR